MKKRRATSKRWDAPKARKATAPAGRRRVHTGATVNPEIRAPKPPGGWVDETRNYVTGERFEDFKPGITPEDAARRLRQAARQQGTGDPYISRGPVLWTMHVLKLEAWYERAWGDGALWDPIRRRPLELRAPRKRTTKKRAARGYKPDPRYGF